ncbi:MAG TPA: hypothetical protein PLP33_25910 [Leptospiraceae bacterium]|nr:hypothetical protein [Leptospiraceae bacterium]
MPRKKKEDIIPKEIDWEEVAEAIREPEEIRMSNIFNEMGYVPGEPPEHLLHGNTCWEDRCKYQQYLDWLYKWMRENNKTLETTFYVGRELNLYGSYRR